MRDAPEPSKAPATATADDPYFILRDTRALFVHRLDQLARLSGISNCAREAFIKGNLRLVLSIVGRFSNSYENMDDLFQIG